MLARVLGRVDLVLVLAFVVSVLAAVSMPLAAIGIVSAAVYVITAAGLAVAVQLVVFVVVLVLALVGLGMAVRTAARQFADLPGGERRAVLLGAGVGLGLLVWWALSPSPHCLPPAPPVAGGGVMPSVCPPPR